MLNCSRPCRRKSREFEYVSEELVPRIVNYLRWKNEAVVLRHFLGKLPETHGAIS